MGFFAIQLHSDASFRFCVSAEFTATGESGVEVPGMPSAECINDSAGSITKPSFRFDHTQLKKRTSPCRLMKYVSGLPLKYTPHTVSRASWSPQPVTARHSHSLTALFHFPAPEYVVYFRNSRYRISRMASTFGSLLMMSRMSAIVSASKMRVRELVFAVIGGIIIVNSPAGHALRADVRSRASRQSFRLSRWRR